MAAEADRTVLRRRTKKKLASALGVKLDAFLIDTNPAVRRRSAEKDSSSFGGGPKAEEESRLMDRSNPVEMMLIGLLRTLTEDQQRELIRIAHEIFQTGVASGGTSAGRSVPGSRRRSV